MLDELFFKEDHVMGMLELTISCKNLALRILKKPTTNIIRKNICDQFVSKKCAIDL